ncbi:MAG: hypothetical protein KC933_09725 [Myxococcales bacterium]|nr:hypothetical protein [Myxococcales bacterium]MCB9647148.1 hypothetical protein [Deltaproteobacteria bacterium]
MSAARWLLCLGLALAAAPEAQAEPGVVTITCDRALQVLSPRALSSDRARKAALRQAAAGLGERSVDLAGVRLDAAALLAIADENDGEPLVRVSRELLRRPVDLDDLILFLDDLLAQQDRLQGVAVVLPPGRARSAGIILHPYDVFRPAKEKRYGEALIELPVAAPTSQAGLQPAKNRAPVGPAWAARYLQPQTEDARLRALAAVNPDFARRLHSLAAQLRDQGAWVDVESTVRRRERGYLIFGAHWLSKADSAKEVRRRIKVLNRLNLKWRLRVPIRWKHPGGWEATVREARRLAETYGVDYATIGGARKSDHYDGEAADLWAVDLPRQVTLRAPDGAKAKFDLSGPDEPRDLSLTPDLISWIEDHFWMKKLRTDYPHWTDDPPDAPGLEVAGP